MDAICALGLAAAVANVIMQLSRLPVGHAVASSTVDAGRVDKHPVKRLRTTSSFLAVATLGSESERRAMRREIDRAHATVRSGPSEAVQYNAFDGDLQLWVAACLYRGMEDVYCLLRPEPAPESLDVLYRHGKRFGTTLQVTEDAWPADRSAFEAYWNASLEQIEFDEVTRPYLLGTADLSFLGKPLGGGGAPVAWAFGPLNRFLTAGFLPPPFGTSSVCLGANDTSAASTPSHARPGGHPQTAGTAPHLPLQRLSMGHPPPHSQASRDRVRAPS